MDTKTPALVVARIVIERQIDGEGGDNVTAEFTNTDGEMPGLVEILGMLELTKDTAIRASMGDDDCGDDCDCGDDE